MTCKDYSIFPGVNVAKLTCFDEGLCLPPANNIHHVLVRDQVRKSYALRDMPRAGTPYQRVLEGIFERAVDAVAHVLDGAVAAYDERFAEVRVDALALGVDANQLQLGPAPI